MKLPFDKDYFKLSFYAVFVLVLAYLFCRIIDSAFYVLFELPDVFTSLGRGLRFLFGVFAPIITGVVIAYILDPVVNYLQIKYEKFRKRDYTSRMAGTVLTYGLLVLFLTGVSLFLYFKIENAQKGILSNIAYLLNSTIDQLIEKISKWEAVSLFNINIYEMISKMGESISIFTNNIVNKAGVAGSFVINLLIGIVIAFYLMKDKKRILQSADKFFSTFLRLDTYNKLKSIFQDINDVFSAYIRGQLTDAVIISVIVGAVLSLIGVEFALLIGIVTGFANLIPYVGAVIGFVLSVLAALLGGSWIKAVIAGVMIIVIQQIDSVYIIPKVVGKKVHLSPPVVIGVLAVFGNLFGLWGLVFAVPVCGVIKKFGLKYLERKKQERSL